jgi:hypothetical protein
MFTLDEGERSSSCTGHFNPGEKPPFPIEYLAGWVTETIWTFGRRYEALFGKRTRHFTTRSPVALPTATAIIKKRAVLLDILAKGKKNSRLL